jgi:tetratricopeptide (TPR) repeat protein
MFLAVAAVLALQSPPSPEDPHLIMHQVRAALRSGSTATLKGEWSAGLARNPNDRLAIFRVATLANITYDFARARQGYQRLVQTPDSLDRYAIHAWLGLSWLALGRQSLDSTRVLMETVARLAAAAGDAQALVQSRSVLGFLVSRNQGIQPALEWFALADRAVPANDPEMKGFVACLRAPHLSMGGAGDAMAEVRRGIELARRASDWWMLGVCYQSAVTVSINASGEAAVVEAYADSAEREHRLSQDHFNLASTLFIRGYGRLLRSEFAGARRALQEAAREAKVSGSVFASAWVHRFLGEIHWLANDLLTADQEYRLAAVELEQQGDLFGVRGLDRRRGGLALDLGRVDEAEAIFRTALQGSEAAGMVDGVYTNRLALAAVQMVRGNWAAAREETERVEVYGRTRGYSGWSAAQQYFLGLASLRLGELDRAERHLVAAIRGTSPGQFLDRYAARSRLAELFVRRSSLPHALREIQDATDEIDSLRASHDDPGLRLLVFQTRREYDEPDLGFATIAAALVSQGYVTEVFQLAERRRARQLADRLLQSQAFEGDTGSAPASARGSAGLGLSDLADTLPEDTALLEYLTGREGQPTTLLILTGSRRLGLVLAPLDSLRDELARFITTLQAGEYPAELGKRLRAAFLDSALSILPPTVRRLVIVPDDALYRLPFDALVLDSGQPIFTRYAVSQVPSAAIAAALRRRPLSGGPSRVLALGDPTFGSDPTDNAYRMAYEAAGGLPRLPGSATEARQVTRYGTRSVLRLGVEASETFIKNTAIEEFNVIHFATHAMVDDRSVARTSLALAPGEGEDGFLSPSEVAALRLRADLIVLSACRTAAGVMVSGEGVQGLSSALLEAGARAILATQWQVEDREVGQLIEDFYRQLAAGAPADEALRQAKLAARERGVSPANWGAFVLIGDPTVRLSLTRAASRWWLWIIFASGVAVALGWAIRRRLG